MAEFDAQAILDTVDADSAPKEWQVYRATKWYFLGQGGVLWFTLLVMVLTLAIVVGVDYHLQSSSWWTDPLSYFQIFIGLLIVGMCVVSFWEGFVLVRQIRSASEQTLVLTPDGFIVRTGPSQWLPAYNDTDISPVLAWAGTKGGRIYSVSYEEMVSVDLHIGNSLFQRQISLIMTFVKPRRLVIWLIVPRFPSRDTIAQSIIEAHMRYKAHHLEAQ